MVTLIIAKCFRCGGMGAERNPLMRLHTMKLAEVDEEKGLIADEVWCRDCALVNGWNA